MTTHTHTFVFPPADGRKVMPGRCDCGARRTGYIAWDDERLSKSKHNASAERPFQPERPVPARRGR